MCAALGAACSVVATNEVLGAAAVHAHARLHPALIARGTLTFVESRLEFVVEPSAHDLRHEELDPADPASWGRAANMLADTIAVLDEHGARLPVTVVEATEKVTRFSANVDAKAHFVTLQLRPSEAAGALAANRQVQLEWTPGPDSEKEGAATARSLRLTTGGNSETVEVRCTVIDAQRTPDLAMMGHARFSRVFLMPRYEHRADGTYIRVIRCSVPLPVLQTWPELAEPRTDVLSADDIASLEERGAAWLAGAVKVDVPKRVWLRPAAFRQMYPVAVRVEDVRIMGPGDSAYAKRDSSATPLCSWSARLTATIVPVETNEDEWIYIYWMAFNAAVGTVDVHANAHPGELRASQCGFRIPNRTSSLPWMLLSEGDGPSVPGR